MPESFTARLPLSRFEIDRDHLARERPELFEELWANPATRVLPLWNGTAPLRDAGSLELVPTASVPLSGADEGRLIYLGRTTAASEVEECGTPVVAAVIDLDTASTIDAEWATLRAVGAVLGSRDAGLFTEALALANWHESHRFSPRSGAPTEARKGGWVRYDPESRSEVFPRTDPAIIVGVTDDEDRLLLGSNALWQNNRYSLLAGFVEPGESLESAVAREIREESGLNVVDAEYLGSQPWPFPASLMLGFSARLDPSDPGVLEPDGTEILELRWFSRHELAASLDDIALPGPTSIARAIIERWYGGTIDKGVAW